MRQRQKTRFGAFEQSVLEALFDVSVPMTVNSIFTALGNEGKPKNGALATTLGRLEDDALVSSEWGEAKAVRGGRRSRQFSITTAGRRAIRDVKKRQELIDLARSMSANAPKPEPIQTKMVTKVYLARMTESDKGHSYYVTIRNHRDQETTPYVTRVLDQALMERDEWAAFFGIEATPYTEDGVVIEASMVMHNFGDDDA